jgi:hypothetical protein
MLVDICNMLLHLFSFDEAIIEGLRAGIYPMYAVKLFH